MNYLFWEATTYCNLNCLHCGSDCSASSTNEDMPLSHFLQAIDSIPHSQAKSITVVITGGEPLLRKDLENCGLEIRKRGMRWSIVTNGLLYTQERHISLLNAGLGAITISLDGLETNHNWLRNNSLSYNKTITAIQLAQSSNRLNFDVVTCVNKRNINELSSILNILVSLSVKAWRLFTISPIGRAKDNAELHLSKNELIYLFDFITATRRTKIIDIKFSCESFVGKYELKVRDSYFFCRAGINIASILIDGSISACPNIDRAFSQGNIYKDDFFETWQTRYEIFRDRNWLAQGSCKNCKDFINCQGSGFHFRQKDNQQILVCHNKIIS